MGLLARRSTISDNHSCPSSKSGHISEMPDGWLTVLAFFSISWLWLGILGGPVDLIRAPCPAIQPSQVAKECQARCMDKGDRPGQESSFDLYSRDQMGCPGSGCQPRGQARLETHNLALLCPELQPQPQDPARSHRGTGRGSPGGLDTATDSLKKRKNTSRLPCSL